MIAPFGAPWLAPFAPLVTELAAPAAAGHWAVCLARLNELAGARGLVNAQGCPLRFIEALPLDLPYERHIFETGQVPTRTGDGAWHDFFNALVWLRFPLIKARLNALQAQALARDGVAGRRGGLRDAATLFDENAALVVLAPGPRRDAWQRHDWPGLFGSGPPGSGPWRAVLFGHALLDKLRAPYKSICAHAWVVGDAHLLAALPGAGAPADDLIEALDAAVAASLTQSTLHRDAFLPLPVLGVPGWWAPSAEPGFYDDPAVFRPRPGRLPKGADTAQRPAPPG